MRTAIVAVVLMCSAAAAAQEDDESRARTLFNEGLAFADHGDWERAVHRFRAALELRDSAQIRFNLAQSLARMDRLVEAIEELQRIDLTPGVEREVREAAGHLLAQSQRRLGRLTVEVRGDAEGTQVTIDGRPLVELNVPVPTDPGVRIARLLRGAAMLDVEEVDVGEGGEASVVLEVARAPSAARAGDNAWIWGLVAGAAALVLGTSIAIGVVATVGID